MDDALRAHVDASLGLIDGLVRRGHQVRETLAVDVIREWQRDCAAAINELSGGSKAHWLSRAYSAAFLVRATDGGVVVEANAGEIVDRILGVLAQGRASLVGIESLPPTVPAAPPAHRFEFVHNLQLRPILAQAFADSGRALEEGDFEHAFTTSCGILEALITDALEHTGVDASTWSFDARIEAAQHKGLIRHGCARLPAIARAYRKTADEDSTRAGTTISKVSTISERDARVVRQVLTVVMRDLDPSR